MATQKVTITVDERLLVQFRQQAALVGMELSPYIARCARNWMYQEDARRLAARDRALGLNSVGLAEAELALRCEAEADAAARRGQHGTAA
ncbi:MAG: hypothetical protein JO100_03115 [Pseudonocardia sp.]|nr:hypothetical protein [Pseudonocardia sp.]